MRVCIHQPTYLPWLGLFHKLSLSDCYVVLDDCQGVRQSWMNRVYVNIGGRAVWLSVPVHFRFSEGQLVKDMRIDNEKGWRRKHVNTLRQNYGKCPHFAELEELMAVTIQRDYTFLMDLDLAGIEYLAERLGIRPRWVKASELKLQQFQGTERIAQIVKSVGGDRYVCGMGSDGYLQPEVLEENGVGLEYQRYQSYPYSQRGTSSFLPGLSIVDTLANIGVEGCRELLAMQTVAKPGLVA